LCHAIGAQGQPIGAGNLADYAFVAKGLLDWATLGGRRSDAALVHILLLQAWRRFYTQKGWRPAEHSALPGEFYQWHIPDGALPSPSATMAEVTARLLGRQEDNQLQAYLDQTMGKITRALVEESFHHATHIAFLGHELANQR
jgi:uncharacterized protein YyaL (SSP411 family)